MSVVYICDKRACRFPQPCRVFWNDYECHHTSNPEHAKNGVCLDPDKHPERFEVIFGRDGSADTYWEKEDES